jgi:hypothetical protein
MQGRQVEESKMTQGRRLQFACGPDGEVYGVQGDMSTYQIRLFRKNSDGAVMLALGLRPGGQPSTVLVIVSPGASF